VRALASEATGDFQQTVKAIGLAGCGAAAEAGVEDTLVIAAVNRCASQNPTQPELFRNLERHALTRIALQTAPLPLILLGNSTLAWGSVSGLLVHRFEISAIEQVLRSWIFFHAIQQANHFAVILLRLGQAAGILLRRSQQIMGACA
jgi:hypothetical protein